MSEVMVVDHRRINRLMSSHLLRLNGGGSVLDCLRDGGMPNRMGGYVIPMHTNQRKVMIDQVPDCPQLSRVP